MEILQLLWSWRCPLANIPQLNCQVNYSAVSSQPPLQNLTDCSNCHGYNFLAWTTQKTPFFYCCACICCHGNVLIDLLSRNSRCLFALPCSHCIATTVHGTILLSHDSGRHTTVAHIKVKVKVMLWPTVSQQICLEVKSPSGVQDQFLLLSGSCRFVDVGHPPWWQDGFVVYNFCWPSLKQSFLGLSPMGLMTIFYCLTFKTLPNWRARSPYLHSPWTGWSSCTLLTPLLLALVIQPQKGRHRKHHFQQFYCCKRTHCHGSMFSKPLPGNAWVYLPGMSQYGRSFQCSTGANNKKSKKKSVQHLAQQIGVSTSSEWEICHDDLLLFPYKMQLSQPLSRLEQYDITLLQQSAGCY
jgi:hypothetical protein